MEVEVFVPCVFFMGESFLFCLFSLLNMQSNVSVLNVSRLSFSLFLHVFMRSPIAEDRGLGTLSENIFYKL